MAFLKVIRLKLWNTKPMYLLRKCGVLGLALVLDQHAVQQVFATVVIVQDADDVQQGALSGAARNP